VPTALITGVTGQDGSYLAELLLARGYRVFGIVRLSSSSTRERIAHLAGRIELVEADLIDAGSLVAAVRAARPDEVYNLAAQSFVQSSWAQPVLTAEYTALGVTRVLDAVRQEAPGARVFHAGSSEMFGRVSESPQNETTPLRPRSPYGTAKAYAHWTVANYRDGLGLYAASGILFNHDSPRRGPEFVTRKITMAAARISLGQQRELRLGNLESRRDWGFAGEYVDAMWRVLQQDVPDDFVIGTGTTHSVRELCERAFAVVGLDYRDYVVQDPQFFRPVEPDLAVADPAKARDRLGWTAAVPFDRLIEMMVESDLELARAAPRDPAPNATPF
jgi:GDPmannose 4,6-dehydratase